MMRMEQMRRQAQPGGHIPMSAWSSAFWQQLATGDNLTTFLRTSQAASTMATYASQQRQFEQFCTLLLGMPSPHACFQADVVAAWVMGRSVHGFKLSNIELGVYAVCSLARQHGISISASAQPLRSALQAASRHLLCTMSSSSTSAASTQP